MLKIKILELNRHRNETTFRPFLRESRLFYDVGIEFVSGDTFDIAWVGQASIADKSLPLSESVARGVEFCQSIGAPFMIFDGQDSHSLIGTYEVLKATDCLLLCKNTLLADFDMYKVKTVNGRWYWPHTDDGYSIPDIDDHKHRIVLSGTNWLSTVPYQPYEYDRNKVHDVSALFGYDLKSGVEHGIEHYKYYNAHRKRCVDVLDGMTGVDIQMIRGGVKLPPDQYYKTMYNSKMIVAPFGYGEIAPRDMEAAAFGCVLVKPDMSHIRTIPDVYDDERSYVSCKHDYSDLEEKIHEVLDNYEYYSAQVVEGLRAGCEWSYNPERMVRHIHSIMSSLPIVSHEQD